MDSIADIEQQLKDLESVIGQVVILADSPTEEETTDVAEEHSTQVAQEKEEGLSLTASPPKNGATCLPISSSFDGDEIDEMGGSRDTWPYAQLRAQDLCDDTQSFCPWKVVVAYPDSFVGNANRPRVRIFFDNILSYREWNFFYIRDKRDPTKGYLLVPTKQVQNFLAFINQRLRTELAVPKGPSGRSFYLRFNGCGPFRPRYLLHHKPGLPSSSTTTGDVSGFDLEDARTWPTDEDETCSSAWEKLTGEAESRYGANLALLRRNPHDKSKLSAEQRCIKRQERRKKQTEDMLCHLGVVEGAIAKASEIVFFCVDVEAVEVSPHPISEIGIALLDMRKVRDVPPGHRGQDWWPHIEAHHLRINEYRRLANRQYVHGCPEDFQFGESTFPPKNEACDDVRGILKQYVDNSRRIVLVGHDINQDVVYLESMGFDVRNETQRIDTIDSQVLHQAWMQSDNSRALATVLDALSFEYSFLHNAGNDAVHTLRAAIGLAFASTEVSEKARGKAKVEAEAVHERREEE